VEYHPGKDVEVEKKGKPLRDPQKETIERNGKDPHPPKGNANLVIRELLRDLSLPFVKGFKEQLEDLAYV